MRKFLKGAVVVLGVAIGTPALAATVLTLAPTTGHPNLLIAVSGSGFADSEAVDIYIDTVDSLLTVSSATGTLATSITMPAAAQPGLHYVTAIGRRSGNAAHAAFTVSTNWAEDGFGAAHLGWNPFENTLSPSVVPSIELLWSAPVSISGAAPIVLNGKVWVGSSDNSGSHQGVYALNANTGALIWHKTTAAGEAFNASPAVVGGSVYILGYTGILYAFNGVGTLLWSKPLGGIGYSGPAPVVVNGVIYVAFGPNVYALSTDGSILWTSGVGDEDAFVTSTALAVADGVVFVGGLNVLGAGLFAFDASSGNFLWNFSTLDTISSAPAVADGIVYFGTNDYAFYALRAKTGTEIWGAVTGGTVAGSPAVAGGVVYIGSDDGNLYAFNAANGNPVWTAPLPGGSLSNVTIADGVVYVGDNSGNVNAFDAAYGQFLAAVATGGVVYGPAVPVNGNLYFGSTDGNLYAYQPGGPGANALRSRSTAPPAISSLHPDMRLEPVR